MRMPVAAGGWFSGLCRRRPRRHGGNPTFKKPALASRGRDGRVKKWVESGELAPIIRSVPGVPLDAGVPRDQGTVQVLFGASAAVHAGGTNSRGKARLIRWRARFKNMQPTTVPSRNSATAPLTPAVTVFLCVNAAREGQSPTCSRRRRPSVPPFHGPFAVKEVRVPCTGRIQPEHLLKAFETGTDAVCVIACDEGNCHHLEGSRRAKRRIAYVAQLLDDIGLGAQRLMMFHLPGSAREDMVLGVSEGDGPAATAPSPERAAQVQAIIDEVVARVRRLPPNLMPVPGETPPPPEATYEIEQPEEESDE